MIIKFENIFVTQHVLTKKIKFDTKHANKYSKLTKPAFPT